MSSLSLRDYFAGQVIAGMHYANNQRVYGGAEIEMMTIEDWRKKCMESDAQYAYEMAELMIKVRGARLNQYANE